GLWHGVRRAGASRLPQSSDHHIFFCIAMLPIANVKAFPVCAPGKSNWPKILRWISKKFFVRCHLPRSCGALDSHSEHLALPKIRQEKIIVVFGRQRILSVSQRAASRPCAEIVHHPQRVWAARNE